MNESTRRSSLFETLRNDQWWLNPLLVMTGLLLFVIYTTWAIWQGQYYFWNAGTAGIGGYLSPLYASPLYVTDAPGSAPLWMAVIGEWPNWLFDYKYLPASPAWFLVIFPLSFRFTCYYYRKAYYRAFAFSPPACAVGAVPQKNYKGERGLMIFQNIHRYSFYFAVIFVFLLAYEAHYAFMNDGQFGFGVGTFVLVMNVLLIGSYTFGCHSFRHLIGGRRDCFSCTASARTSHKGWSLASILNRNHMFFAWASLIWFVFTDLYIRMVSMGVWTDINTWGV